MANNQIITHCYEGTERERLDRVLFAFISSDRETSRSEIQRWIESGAVTVDGKVVLKVSHHLKSGALISVTPPARVSAEIEAEDIHLDILFEDEDILVINKQSNFVVHPGAGVKKSTLMHALAGHFKKQKLKELPERMGIVHRLDKDTTGVMIICKNDVSLRKVAAQFSSREVKKQYRALVFTTPRGKHIVNRSDSGEVDAPIGRHPTKRIRMAIVEAGGRHATTRWNVVERFNYGALVDVEILTGRTHQIRVHMEHIRSPIVGDLVYGDFSGMQDQLKKAAAEFGRQALHSFKLTLTHPVSGKVMEWSAPLPLDFEDLLARFRKS